MEMPKMKPSMHVSADDLPEIKDWDVGKTYRMEITARQTSKDEYKPNGKVELSAGFEITKIKPIGEQSKMEKLEKKYGD